MAQVWPYADIDATRANPLYLCISTLKLAPDADQLASALEGISRREFGSKDTSVDRWFRVPCTAEVIGTHGTVVLQDDLGLFFQKWMLLVRDRANQEPIYSMGSSARFRGQDVVLSSSSGDVTMSSVEVRELLDELGNELDRQLSTLSRIDVKCEADIRHYTEEYLRPPRMYVAGT